MSTRSIDIAIAGAGIAGLTAALAFARGGFSVLVLERAPVLQEAGAGLQLSPNATRILDRLGVLDALVPKAMRPRAVELKSAESLKSIAQVPLGDAAEKRWGAPYLVAHRADLQAALLKSVADAPDITLLTGATAKDVRFDGNRVHLIFERSGMQESAECRLAIGADGVWSRLRVQVRPQAASRFTGYLAWRAMLAAAEPAGEGSRTTFEPDAVTAFLSPRFHLVAYPIDGGKGVNLVAVTRGRALTERWTVWPSTGALNAATARAAPALRTLIETAAPWTAWPIHIVDSEPAWTRPEGLALIGDAAHAVTPFAAQGAAMAIEDAAVLAELAAQAPDDLKAVLARFEATRRPRVKRVAARGALNRFVWHATGLVALSRNVVLRLRPSAHLARDFDWLYGWDAKSAAEEKP